MDIIFDGSIVLEQTGINIKNEKSLHSAIKRWYSRPGDRMEVKTDRFIIDIVRDDWLIEIQTKNFSAIGAKLRKLIKSHKVRLVYPIAVEKWIVTYDEKDGNVIGRRKSPKKGSIIDVFKEMVRITDIINESNFVIEALLITEEEFRCKDGKGSWRRKGISIVDRKLIDVRDCVVFTSKQDYTALLPQDLENPFTNRILAQKLKIPINKAQKMTYCLKKIGVIEESGKVGNGLLYARKELSI